MRRPMAFMRFTLALAMVCGFLACGDSPKTGGRTKTPDFESTPRPQRRTSGKQSKAPTLGDIPNLDLERAMVKEEAPDKDAIVRTLFAFEEDPVEVLKRREKAEEEKKAREEAQRKAAEQAKIAQEKRREAEKAAGPPPPPKPVPPPINFTFIGYFGYPDDRIGVFQGKTGEEQELAGEGDVIFGKYTVVELGYESAKIGFEGFTETERIPLAGGGGK